MVHTIPDDRLRGVCEGYELLTDDELAALMPEVAREGSIQGMIVSAVMARRLRVLEETANPAKVISLRAKSKTRRPPR